jgi:peptide/nickel transport system substrate-binding protein
VKYLRFLPILGIFSILLLSACSSDEETTSAAPAAAAPALSQGTVTPGTGTAAAPKAAASSGTASAPAADATKTVAAAASGGGGDPVYGGTLRYVPMGAIKYVDPMATGAIVTGTISRHVYDQLFWRDKDYNIYPQLLSEWGMSDDGKTYTFTVREGVTHHGGDALTLEDIAMSHDRFARVDPLGRNLLDIAPGNADRELKDRKFDQTYDGQNLIMKFDKPTGMVLEFLAQLDPRQPSIMHKDIWSVKPGEPVNTAHGTGPYKMDSFKQGDKVVMSKFENYSPNVGEEWNFTKGEIVQYLDGFVGFDIPDHAARVAALQTNEVDVLDDFKIDLAFNLMGVEDVTWGAYKDGNYGGYVFNAHHAPFDMSEAGRLARRAVTAAINNEKVMKTAVGNPDMWRSCYLVIHCGNGWTSVVSDEVQAEGIKTRTGDMVYAKKLLAEAEALSPGISEMPVRIINSFDVAVIAEESLVMWESLINLGFVNAKINTMDWGSGAGMVGKDGPWEIFTQWSNFANGLNPLAPHMFSGKTGNGYLNPKIDVARAAFLVETDPKKQQSLYDDMNRIFYENPPSVNNFQFASPRAHRNEVKGFCLDCLFPILNNVWIEK